MPDVNIKYNGSSIATMDASGTKTMKTGGKYTAEDITVEYTKPTPVLQTKTATPGLSQQSITPDSGKDGLSSVTVGAITQQLLASLDADFVAENIKKDVNLFGLLGTLEGGGSNVKFGTYTPSSDTTSRQTITHGLGVDPNTVIFFDASSTFYRTEAVFFNAMILGYGGIRCFYYSSALTTVKLSVSGTSSYWGTGGNNADCCAAIQSTTFKTPTYLASGHKYVWIVLADAVA